jgi:Cu(I)-responsive transcriptional regulator
MNIGAAAKASGVSAKMIRYYEQLGLIRAADRKASNYRDFSDRDEAELRFVRSARSLGFSMDEIARLLALWRDRDRPSREVKAIAERHIADLEVRIAEMQAMAESLRHLARACAGDDRPDCPILSRLETPPRPS